MKTSNYIRNATNIIREYNIVFTKTKNEEILISCQKGNKNISVGKIYLEYDKFNSRDE